MLTIYIIFGTKCSALIWNIAIIIYLPHLFTAATLPLEINQVLRNYNFQSYQSKLNIIIVAQSKTSSSLSEQPARVQVQLLYKVFKISSIFIHTGLN